MKPQDFRVCFPKKKSKTCFSSLAKKTHKKWKKQSNSFSYFLASLNSINFKIISFNSIFNFHSFNLTLWAAPCDIISSTKLPYLTRLYTETFSKRQRWHGPVWSLFSHSWDPEHSNLKWGFLLHVPVLCPWNDRVVPSYDVYLSEIDASIGRIVFMYVVHRTKRVANTAWRQQPLWEMQNLASPLLLSALSFTACVPSLWP